VTAATVTLDPVFLSRIQFGFVIGFHIIFPAFTIGLAAWLATIEGMRLATGNPVYQRVFDFWLKVFAVSFGVGVVTGVVMAFQFGTNWGVLSERMGAIQGPLLGYETFTAFMLEATFFGVMLLGRGRVSPGFYFFACCMVSLGTMFSSFWILCNNSWMQVPMGHTVVDGKIIPSDWWSITTGPIVRVRWPHMLLGAFLTTGMSVVATGAWYTLRGIHPSERRVMLHWGLGLVAVLIPIQMCVGNLTGGYIHKYQPAKFAAIEARWKTQQPASEVLLAIPDPPNERDLFAVKVPKLGSYIESGTWNSREVGLEAFAPEDRPPVIIPFFAFRVMVGMGFIMFATSWWGVVLRWRGSLETSRWFLWCAFLSFPTGFIAVLCGWFTAEVGRQPWIVYGILRTKDAVTPSLTTGDVIFSLLAYIAVYGTFGSFGLYYIYSLLRDGPSGVARAIPDATANRPMAFAGDAQTATGNRRRTQG
jgi:cytochrome bd ubiquinol oxidase subunit I